MMALTTWDAFTLAGILQRWIKDPDLQHRYFCWGENVLTLDGSIDITDAEQRALETIRPGDDWWEQFDNDG